MSGNTNNFWNSVEMQAASLWQKPEGPRPRLQLAFADLPNLEPSTNGNGDRDGNRLTGLFSTRTNGDDGSNLPAKPIGAGRIIPQSDYQIAMPLAKGLDIRDVDWEKVFLDAAGVGYENPIDLRQFRDSFGNYDYVRIAQVTGYHNPKLLVTEEGKPDISAIIEHIKQGQNMDLIRFAIPKPEEISEADRIKVSEVLVTEGLKVLSEEGNLPKFIKWLETLFPLFYNGTVKVNFPKIFQREYIFKTPLYFPGTEDEYRAAFRKNGFKGKELERLTQQMVKYGKAVWHWRSLAYEGALPLKDGSVHRLEQGGQSSARLQGGRESDQNGRIDS